MNSKQQELLEIAIKDTENTLSLHLENFLEYNIKNKGSPLTSYYEDKVMTFVLIKTILKSYKKELEKGEK